MNVKMVENVCHQICVNVKVDLLGNIVKSVGLKNK